MKRGQHHLLRATGHRRMPWKNGLGITTEIAVGPPDATLADFDWRLSMARIDADGPFSRFPNIDRLLVMLNGQMHLAIEGRPLIKLTPQDEPVMFPGELAVMGSLATSSDTYAQPAIDLNVMVRRGRYEAQMQRLVIKRRSTVLPTANVTALICRTAGLRISHEQGTDILDLDDVFLVSARPSHPLELSHDATAMLYVVHLTSAMHDGQSADDVDTIVLADSAQTTAT